MSRTPPGQLVKAFAYAGTLQGLVSLRHHNNPCINGKDFEALKVFEAAHPNLYANCHAPRPTEHWARNVGAQMAAFNNLWNHPQWGRTFQQLLRSNGRME